MLVSLKNRGGLGERKISKIIFARFLKKSPFFCGAVFVMLCAEKKDRIGFPKNVGLILPNKFSEKVPFRQKKGIDNRTFMCYFRCMSTARPTTNNFGVTMYKKLKLFLAKRIAEKRLSRFCKKHKIELTEAEYSELSKSLAKALYGSKLFRQRRCSTYAKFYCAQCSNKRESNMGEFCVVHDMFLDEKDESVCCGYECRECALQ